jgi:hypothetical protein
MAEPVTLGRNIKVSIAKDVLTINIDLKAQRWVSSSEKSMMIASTLGNQTVPANGEELKLGVNLYTRKT